MQAYLSKRIDIRGRGRVDREGGCYFIRCFFVRFEVDRFERQGYPAQRKGIILFSSQGKQVIVTPDGNGRFRIGSEVRRQIGLRKRLELLRQNGFTVSDTGYFVYCNGRRDKKAFDGKLEFEVVIIPYTGDASWIEGALVQARKCLSSSRIPKPSPQCEYCSYRQAAAAVE